MELIRLVVLLWDWKEAEGVNIGLCAALVLGVKDSGIYISMMEVALGLDTALVVDVVQKCN